jgi:Tol biopolymer transport system component
LAVCFALFASAVGVAWAEAPPGPRLALTQFSRRGVEVVTTDPAGASPSFVAGGGRRAHPLPYPLSPLSWLPSGSAVIFSGASGKFGESLGSDRENLYLAPSDGGPVKRIAGTQAGVYPVASPDGSSVAFIRILGANASTVGHRVFMHSSIWIAAIDGSGSPRRLTPWHKGIVELPRSFSPDGGELATERAQPKEHSTSVVSVRVSDGHSTLIARQAGEPTYSPDGSKLAYVGLRGRGTDVYVADADGANAKRITSTDTVETSPSWDPGGQRLAYLQLAPLKSEVASIGFNDSVVEVNADGTCPTKVLSKRGTAYLGPRWQPGPGREAGSISC